MDFFEHENHDLPPSLASNNIMHQTSKADMQECLEALVSHIDYVHNVVARIVDGVVLVHWLDPHKSKHKVKIFRHQITQCIKQAKQTFWNALSL